MVLLQEKTPALVPFTGGYQRAEDKGKSNLQPQKEARLEDTLSPDCVHRGIRVTLENNSMWTEFHRCCTEMIVTKQGSRMFPYCRFRISGLSPQKKYILLMDLQPANDHRYRWGRSGWQVCGRAEIHVPVAPFAHPESPSSGQHWMQSPVSFYRLKLTSDTEGQGGNIVLHLNQRYRPRLHMVQTDQARDVKLSGPGVVTFTFPQTEFMAVSAYQNTRFAQLKVEYNPFSKGLRDDTATKGLKLNSTQAQNPLKKSLKFLLANHKPKSSKPAQSNEKEQGGPSTSADPPKIPPTDKASSSSTDQTRSAAQPPSEQTCNNRRPSQKLFSEQIRDAHVSLQRYITPLSDPECSSFAFEPISSASSPEPLPTIPDSLTLDFDPSDIAKRIPQPSKDFSHTELSVFKWHTVLPPQEPCLASSFSPFQPASTIQPSVLNSQTESGPSSLPAEASAFQEQSLPFPGELSPLALQFPGSPTFSSLDGDALSPTDLTELVHFFAGADADLAIGDEFTNAVTDVQTAPEEHTGQGLAEITEVNVEPQREKRAELIESRPKQTEQEQTRSEPAPKTQKKLKRKRRCGVSKVTSQLDLDPDPSYTVMKPSLEEVEEQLFVSFTSKEALELHLGDSAENSPPGPALGSSPAPAPLAPSPPAPALSQMEPDPTPVSPPAAALPSSAPVSLLCTSDIADPRNVTETRADSPPEALQDLVSCPRTESGQESDDGEVGEKELDQTKPDSAPTTEDANVQTQTYNFYKIKDETAKKHTTTSQDEEEKTSRTCSYPEPDNFYTRSSEQHTSVEEQLLELEKTLLRDVRLMKYKQVIHPLLQEVGLKMSLLDASLPVDLQYLGIPLPLPPPQANQEPGPGLGGGFVSRTGKTTDVTQIKGWRDKFTSDSVLPLEAPPVAEPVKKNLSAFCSDMLDEYLEMEGKLLDERASSFTSADPPAPVTFDLFSSSYVHTLPTALTANPAVTANPALSAHPASSLISGFVPPSKRPKPAPSRAANKTFKQKKKAASVEEAKKFPEPKKPKEKSHLFKSAFVFNDDTPSVQLKKFGDADVSLSLENESMMDSCDFMEPLCLSPKNKRKGGGGSVDAVSQSPSKGFDPNHTEPISEEASSKPPGRGRRRRRRYEELELMAPLESDSELCNEDEKLIQSQASFETSHMEGQKEEVKEEKKPTRLLVTKALVKQRDMEQRGFWEGKPRTYVTQERATVALSSLFTLKGFVAEDPRLPLRLTPRPAPRCLNDFCRLGCMCSSLNYRSRPSHCRRAQCLLRCSCLKQKVVLLRNLDSMAHSGRKRKRRRRMKMAYVLKEAETVSQPAPPVRTLWTKTDSDPDQVSVPPVSGSIQTTDQVKEPGREGEAQISTRVKPDQKRKEKINLHRLPDPDPKPLALRNRERLSSKKHSVNPDAAVTIVTTESEESCARVREFRGCTQRTQTTTENSSATKASALTSSIATSPLSKRLVLLANCKWQNEGDRVSVLKVLCEALTLGTLERPFWIGPYFVSPFSPTQVQKNGKMCAEVRVHISTPKAIARPGRSREGPETEHCSSQGKQVLEDGEVDCPEDYLSEPEARTVEPGDIHVTSSENLRETPEPEMEFTPDQKFALPYLQRISPAGFMWAKLRGSEENCVQVNGKAYPQAKVQLGRMGALHPANRLAAYLTGRVGGAYRPVSTPSPVTCALPGISTLSASTKTSTVTSTRTSPKSGSSLPSPTPTQTPAESSQTSAGPVGVNIWPRPDVSSQTPLCGGETSDENKPLPAVSKAPLLVEIQVPGPNNTPLQQLVPVRAAPTPTLPSFSLPMSVLTPLPKDLRTRLTPAPVPNNLTTRLTPAPVAEDLKTIVSPAPVLNLVPVAPVSQTQKLISQAQPPQPSPLQPLQLMGGPTSSSGVRLFRTPDGRLMQLIPLPAKPKSVSSSATPTVIKNNKQMIVYRRTKNKNGEVTLVPLTSQAPVIPFPTQSSHPVIAPTSTGMSGLQKFTVSSSSSSPLLSSKTGYSFKILQGKSTKETVVVRTSELAPKPDRRNEGEKAIAKSAAVVKQEIRQEVVEQEKQELAVDVSDLDLVCVDNEDVVVVDSSSEETENSSDYSSEDEMLTGAQGNMKIEELGRKKHNFHERIRRQKLLKLFHNLRKEVRLNQEHPGSRHSTLIKAQRLIEELKSREEHLKNLKLSLRINRDKLLNQLVPHSDNPEVQTVIGDHRRRKDSMVPRDDDIIEVVDLPKGEEPQAVLSEEEEHISQEQLPSTNPATVKTLTSLPAKVPNPMTSPVKTMTSSPVKATTPSPFSFIVAQNALRQKTVPNILSRSKTSAGAPLPQAVLPPGLVVSSSSVYQQHMIPGHAPPPQCQVLTLQPLLQSPAMATVLSPGDLFACSAPLLHVPGGNMSLVQVVTPQTPSLLPKHKLQLPSTPAAVSALLPVTQTPSTDSSKDSPLPAVFFKTEPGQELHLQSTPTAASITPTPSTAPPLPPVLIKAEPGQELQLPSAPVLIKTTTAAKVLPPVTSAASQDQSQPTSCSPVQSESSFSSLLNEIAFLVQSSNAPSPNQSPGPMQLAPPPLVKLSNSSAASVEAGNASSEGGAWRPMPKLRRL
uniref:MAX gene-associated protein n=1 Tax=Knipowitschia caucasica TaxID=637954 RepID=A0AAV2JI96_KNICA